MKATNEMVLLKTKGLAFQINHAI